HELLPLAPAHDRLLEPGALAAERGELAPIRDDAGIDDEPLELVVAPLDLLQSLQHVRLRRKRGSAPRRSCCRGRVRRPPRHADAGFPPLPYLRLKRSTRPAVSTSFCLPVKKGWHAEQISTWIDGTVERVSTTLPHAHAMTDFWYFG